MHLELVDVLRCTSRHSDSVLVAAADRIESRYVVQGVLGCPVCGREFPIVDGVTYFSGDSPSKAAPTAAGEASAVAHALQRAANGVAEANATVKANRAKDVQHFTDAANDAMALAAQLALHEGRGTYAVIGYPLSAAVALRTIVPVRLLVVNPPGILNAFAALRHAIGVAPIAIISATTLPVANARLDSLAVSSESTMDVATVCEALRSRGRAVAPIAVAIPPGVRELVRDSTVWVGERESAASAPVMLRRATRP